MFIIAESRGGEDGSLPVLQSALAHSGTDVFERNDECRDQERFLNKHLFTGHPQGLYALLFLDVDSECTVCPPVALGVSSLNIVGVMKRAGLPDSNVSDELEEVVKQLNCRRVLRQG